MKSMLSTVLLFLMMALPVFAGQAEEGQGIFKTRCGLCHQLPDPNMLDREQWKHVLDSMQKLMEKSGWGKLSEEEYKKVLTYLNGSARGVTDRGKDDTQDAR